MMKKKYLIGLVAVVMAAALALVGCSSGGSNSSNTASKAPDNGYTLVNPGKLTVEASLDFPPFENLEEGKPVGFSVDLATALAEQMGLEVNYLNSMKFDAIVPSIAAGGKADIGVSSFTITAERAKEIDFTDPYIDSNQAITVMKDSEYTTVDQLAGKRIGAQSGTTGYDWAAENIAGAEVVAFDEMTAVFAALQAGQLDAVAVDLPVAQSYVKTSYQDAHIIAEIPTGEQYGIVVSKSSPKLTEDLNAALKAIEENGVYSQIYVKWFGVEPTTSAS